MRPYKLIRSRRKTIAIYIAKDATVEVRAPMKTSLSEIDAFVKKKEKWIDEHIARRERVNGEKQAFAPDYGDDVLLFGKLCQLSGREEDSIGYDAEGEAGSVWIPADLTADSVKRALVYLYQTALKKYLDVKINDFARRMKVMPTGVRINSAKSRWGSCSAKGSINFSWRLVMADTDTIDYVVVHELAHLLELNHSPQFWAIVEEVLPDYKKRQKKLKILQDKLASQDWD